MSLVARVISCFIKSLMLRCYSGCQKQAESSLLHSNSVNMELGLTDAHDCIGWYDILLAVY